MPKTSLDAIDRKILKYLIKNARMPFLEIARECGISGAAIHQRIRNKKTLRFSELVDDQTPTPVVVVTFLAILELYKRSMVTLRQNEQFGDIDIAYIEGSGELDLTGDDALTSVGEEG